MNIAKNLKAIKDDIESAAISAGREPSSVRLVAVSKTHPAEAVIEAFNSGQIIFGENYVQELVEKAEKVKLPVQWHYIGHLQSNKVRQIADFVDTIHSVDKFSTAEEISRQYAKRGRCCNILIQINIADEDTKSGISETSLIQLVKDISKLPAIKINGLMAIPPFCENSEDARKFFRRLKELSLSVKKEKIENVSMDELSMGMSSDYRTAIEEGATFVRIGSAIFGERDYSK